MGDFRGGSTVGGKLAVGVGQKNVPLNIMPPAIVSTWRDHNVAAAYDAAITSPVEQDSWIWCDAGHAQWGIYHRNVNSDLAVSGEKTLPGNSIGFVGGNSLQAYINLATGDFWAKKVYGAVYNDYAECRQSKVSIKAGKLAVEGEDGYIVPASKRMQKTAMVVSDTFGFCLAEQEIEGELSIPIAVAGRALVYTDKDRKTFKPGDVVCAGKDGTVSKMRWFEKILFPDRIVGVVSEIPKYKTWGQSNVEVDNRIWIRVN